MFTLNFVNSIYCCRSLRVRVVRSSDIEQVELLCQGIDGSHQVIADIKQYLVTKRDPIDEVREIPGVSFHKSLPIGGHAHLLCCCGVCGSGCGRVCDTPGGSHTIHQSSLQH